MVLEHGTGDKWKQYPFLLLLLAGGLVFFAGYGIGELRHNEQGMALQDERLPEEPQTEPAGAGGQTPEENAGKQSGGEEALSENGLSKGYLEESLSQEGLPEPVFVTVGDDYFDDAAFIGDSRIVGLYDYSGLEKSGFYCSSGLTVYKLFEDPDGKFKDGTWKENIGVSLQNRQFQKIYLMLGINEMGVGDEAYFARYYQEALDRIRELQPEARIYIQSIMRVSRERSEKGDYINNEEIDKRNAAIAALADNKSIFYLDVNEAVCDESGALNPEYTFDGVHLYAQYIDIWMQYLREHAVKE